MRDPNRIEPFMNELGEIWKNNCPDWRFGQLMFNVQRVMKSHGTDIFYMEDKELLEYFREWFGIDETQCRKPEVTIVFDGDVPLTHKLGKIKNFKIFVDDKEEK